MKTTPLKKPITVTFDSVERAVMYSHLSEDVATGRTISERAKKMNDILAQSAGSSVADQIRGHLGYQGINWRSWEPSQSITIGSYQVEFKLGHINVGCKSITNETVRAILDRLEGKASQKNRASIKTHGDLELSKAVSDLAFQHGAAHGILEWPHAAQFIYFGCHPGKGWLDSGNIATCFDDTTLFDARTQFGAILDFFKQAKAHPDIKIQGDPVKFESGSIVIEGHRVSTATVKEIVKQLI